MLDAIKWMKASWDDLPTSTIEKCFIHCGFKEEDNPADSDFTSQSNIILFQLTGDQGFCCVASISFLNTVSSLLH